MVSADLVGDGGAQRHPTAIINRLDSQVAQFMKAPDVQERFASLGLVPLHSTPQQITKLVRTGATRMGKVIRAAGLQPE